MFLCNKCVCFCVDLPCSVSQTFKSLFLLFAGPLVVPFCKIIEECNHKKKQGKVLGFSKRWRNMYISQFVCVCVCVLPRNLYKYLILLVGFGNVISLAN